MLKWAITAGTVGVLILAVTGLLIWRGMLDLWQTSGFEEGFGEAARRPAPLTKVRTGTLPGRLRESSGVAASRTQPGILWTHNDSGDKARIYAVDFTGKIFVQYSVDDAKARDWEDIALGPCPGQSGDCLYVADTGDNRRRRSSYRVYVVREPTVDRTAERAKEDVDLLGRTTFEYPGGIAEDTEALAVSPTGEVLIVTKGRSGSVRIFSLGVLDLTDRDARTTARLLATLPIIPQWNIGRAVTGAAFSADGALLAVRTYSELYIFSRGDDGSFTQMGEPCYVGDLSTGGEAVDFLGDSALVLTSERDHGEPGSIDVVTCARGAPTPFE